MREDGGGKERREAFLAANPGMLEYIREQVAISPPLSEQSLDLIRQARQQYLQQIAQSET